MPLSCGMVEGLYKGIYSTILHQENYNTSKEKNVFLESIMLQYGSMRDTEWDPGLPSFIPVVQHVDGNTTSKSSHTPIGNQKYRLLIHWQ